MMAADLVQVRVAGTLTCIDSGGARPLAADEFHDVMDRIAGHLDDEAGIADACTWGQASTGDMEISFVVAGPVAGPELNQRVGSVIAGMGEAAGLIWPSGPGGAASGWPGRLRAMSEVLHDDLRQVPAVTRLAMPARSRVV